MSSEDERFSQWLDVWGQTSGGGEDATRLEPRWEEPPVRLLERVATRFSRRARQGSHRRD